MASRDNRGYSSQSQHGAASNNSNAVNGITSHRTTYDPNPVATINNSTMSTMSTFNSVSQEAYNAVTTGTTNLTKFGRTVTTTASSLYNGDLTGVGGTNSYYSESLKESMAVMRTMTNQPAFQKRFFSFSKRAPSEVVRDALGESKEEIQFKALTKIPEELLFQVPPSINQFSLFQGFKATTETSAKAALTGRDDKSESANDNSIEGLKQLTDGTVSGKVTRKKLLKDKSEIEHTLDLLEIRKDLAANEIHEIDQKIAFLRVNRNLVFERVAQLEQEEFTLENKLKYLNMQTEMVGDDDEDDDKETDLKSKSSKTGKQNKPEKPVKTKNDSEDGNNDALLSQSIFGKLENHNKTDKSKKVLHRVSPSRKTKPTLQQYYNAGDNIRIFNAHEDAVTSLSFDIPFGTMVSASVDDTCKVWDLGRGTCKGYLSGHNAYVTSLHMENNLVVSGSMDATAKLWDLSLLDFGDDSEEEEENQQQKPDDDYCIQTFDSHVREVTALHFYQDTLVTGSADKTIRQWDLRSGRCLQTLDVLWAAAQSASSQFSDSGNTWRGNLGNLGSNNNNSSSNAPFVGALQVFDAALASGTADGVVRLWDLRSGQVQRSLVGHTGPVTCLQFDDMYLTTGSMDRSIRVWDLRTGSIVDAFAYESPISSLHFSSRRIVSANGENTVKVYDRETGRHWTCGPGAINSDNMLDDNAQNQELPQSNERIKVATFKEGYLVEGRENGTIGTWAC